MRPRGQPRGPAEQRDAARRARSPVTCSLRCTGPAEPLPNTPACALQNPVPADQLTPEALGCGNKGGAPGTLASSASSGSKSSVASPAPAPSPSPAPTEPEAEAEVASESPASPPPAPPAAPEEEQPAATVEEARPAEQQQQQSAAAAGEGGTYTDLAAALEAAGYSFSG